MRCGFRDDGAKVSSQTHAGMHAHTHTHTQYDSHRIEDRATYTHTQHSQIPTHSLKQVNPNNRIAHKSQDTGVFFLWFGRLSQS